MLTSIFWVLIGLTPSSDSRNGGRSIIDPAVDRITFWHLADVRAKAGGERLLQEFTERPLGKLADLIRFPV